MYKIKHYYTMGHIESDLILENMYVCLFLQEKTGNKKWSLDQFAANMYLFLIIKIEMKL